MIHLIYIPILAGFLCLIIPRIKEILAILASLYIFAHTIALFFFRPLNNNYIGMDNLNSFILPAIGLFGFLITLYSLKFMSGKKNLKEYYTYILWTIGASCGVVLANNLILLLIFWGFLGFTLYRLIEIGGPDAAFSAKKTFIIVGGSDAFMIMGIGIIWFITKSFAIDAISIPVNGFLPVTAYILIAVAAFAKAGAMPLHTWIPDSAEHAPVPVMAFLPASLDKLLGIYLLARISLDIFVLTANSIISNTLLVLGSVTIVAAVMMALIQHNAKKLLSYHAVSQVGYMVLGIGTCTPIGIAGGLFHMLNHAIYKCCLFLSAGNVETKTGTSELDKLGGLGKLMPITFLSFLIASLSISGVPPLNGFVSKWMVYQGIIQLQSNGSKLWPVWLISAMFGSALTLASFMKLIHAIFLGRAPTDHSTARGTGEVKWQMWFPAATLAFLCVIFGIFAYQIPLKLFINPAAGISREMETGIWHPGTATLLIVTGIILGLILYIIGNIKKIRIDTSRFIGGETLPEHERITGTEFYNTIKDIGFLGFMYKKAEQKTFDIYEQGVKYALKFTNVLRRLHNGILSTYLAWCLLGMIILFFILIRQGS